ncbi:site-2 protease family protein [sulfur-oxidizing endosymbiont of Gigantopelta aegis]|uniref:site-2 protease family protein n=1 Tax=sulfur-oxidizing endosymbiont of Gigantopelta aegis TaxID=2794934 RepID=UPI0018DD5E53|nr:site-2 protease family protein [sulfur-oxidizing endosymbiont of Gigantopelta aegis]
MDAATIQKITIWILPVLFAVSLHEAAHAWMADRKGDSTARLLGRLTFNPFKHIDPIGTVVVPILMITLTGFAFGWAKPVPIDVRNLRNPKKDMMWVALAGPASNFIMAFIWAIILHFSVMFVDSRSSISLFFLLMPVAGITINVILGVLNLLPIPPLDGGRIMAGLLSPRASQQYGKIEPYGFFIIIGLMVTGMLSYIIFPVVSLFMVTLAAISGLDAEVFYRLLNGIQ